MVTKSLEERTRNVNSALELLREPYFRAQELMESVPDGAKQGSQPWFEYYYGTAVPQVLEPYHEAVAPILPEIESEGAGVFDLISQGLSNASAGKLASYLFMRKSSLFSAEEAAEHSRLMIESAPAIASLTNEYFGRVSE